MFSHHSHEKKEFLFEIINEYHDERKNNSASILYVLKQERASKSAKAGMK